MSASAPEFARAWIDAARFAPSGDNSQPWLVTLRTDGDRVVLQLALNAATVEAPSFFDCAFAASHLSLGAFLQNVVLMARGAGFAPGEVRRVSERFETTFSPAAGRVSSPDDMADLIRRRTTNRLPYRTDSLAPSTINSLAESVSVVTPGVTLRAFTGEEHLRLAAMFGALDRCRYRNRRLFLEFLEKLRFGAEAERERDGLRDQTLGVPAGSLVVLRLLRAARRVPGVHGLFHLGLERAFAYFGCELLVRKSAAVGVLGGGEDTPRGWFELGRAFQQLWLETTKREIALQPLGTTLLIYRWERESGGREPKALTTREGEILGRLRDRFRDEFKLDFSRPAILFRLGYAPPVAGTSLRRPVAIHA